MYVYAQTLVIDSSVEFRYSLLIRARQVIMDYSQTHYARIDHYGPVFDMYNLTDAIYMGALLHQCHQVSFSVRSEILCPCSGILCPCVAYCKV